MAKSKSIVLYSETSDQKAVLTLEQTLNNVIGRLRLYNFSSIPTGIMSLGFKNKDKVITCGLTQAGTNLFNFKTSYNDIPDTFSCALVSVHGGQAKPLLYGNSSGKQNPSDIFAGIISNLYEDSSLENTTKVLDEYGIDYDEQEKNEIENLINSQITKQNCDYNCENCKYKKFYEQMAEGIRINSTSENNDNTIKVDEEEENEKKDLYLPNFYAKLKEQIDDLFTKFPHEEYLESIIDNSSWVKVDYENTGDYYVFGLVKVDNCVKYVCYGVPAVFSKNAPKEIVGYPFWLPLEKDKNDGFGYWITYQDSETGESVKAII